MNVAKVVRELANWPESGHLIVSLYLNTKWGGEEQREKVRIFVKDRLRSLEKEMEHQKNRWAAVKEDVRYIREYVDDLVALRRDADYDGIAVFCCDHENLRTVLRSRIPFPNAFHVAPRPRIRPLAHMYDEYERAIFADVGSTDAAIYVIDAGEIGRSLRVENDVPGRHKQGGWSQARFGRRIEEMMDHHHREVADHLTRIVYKTDCRNVILSGTERVVANFRTFLPRYVDDAVIARESLDRNPAPDKVVKTCILALQDAERRREESVMKSVTKLKANPKKVAAGLESVLEALAHGRVHRLLLSDRFAQSGFRCQSCGRIAEETSEECRICAEPVIPTDLAEAMVVSTVQRGGEVDEMVDRPELESLGGVAALLRY